MEQIALLHYTAPPVIGHTENTIFHHARLFNQSGYQVRVISGTHDEAYYQISFRHQVELFGIDEMNPDHPVIKAINAALGAGLIPPEFDPLVKRLAAQLKPVIADVPVCFAYNAVISDKNLALTAALRQLVDSGSARLIAWCQELPSQVRPDAPDSPWGLLSAPWPNVRYVAAQPAVQQALVDSLGLEKQDIRLVPPGIDASLSMKWEPETRRLVKLFDLQAARPILILPTAMTAQRGIEFALRTIAALLDDLPEAHLLVVNIPLLQTAIDQPYLDSLQALCEQHGISGHIHFIHKGDEQGSLLGSPKAVLSDLYRLADLLLLPDPSPASLGASLLEAGLARLPVFAVNPFPLGESSDGLVHRFTLEAPHRLAKRIAAYLEKDPFYQARGQVLNDYIWQTILERYLLPLVKA